MSELVSADHIAAQKGAFEPQRKNNFSLNFTIRDGTGVDKLIKQSLDSFTWPKEENTPIDIAFGNEKRKVAGVASFDNCELVLKDFADQPVMREIIKWRRKVYKPLTGEIGLAKDYKEQGEVVMFAPNGTLERRWKLMGMWPSKMDPGGGDMNSNTNNLISVTITIDKAVEVNV